MARYNHMFSIAFTVESEQPDGSDVTALMLFAGLLRRILAIESEPISDSWEEACGAPDDSYEIDEEGKPCATAM